MSLHSFTEWLNYFPIKISTKYFSKTLELQALSNQIYNRILKLSLDWQKILIPEHTQ